MDTEYIITCAMELGEVSPLEGAMLHLSGKAYKQIRRAVDSNSADGHDFVANTCREVLAEASPRQLAIASVAALCETEYLLRSNLERLTHLVFMQARKDLYDGVVNSSFHELLTGERLVGDFFGPLNPLCEQSVRVLLDSRASSVKDRFALDVDALLQAREALFNPKSELSALLSKAYNQVVQSATNLELVTKRLAGLMSTDKLPDSLKQVYDVTPKQGLGAAIKDKAREAAKRSLKKAVKLFQNHKKQNVLMNFLDGGDVELSHPTSAYKFIIRAPLGTKNWLIDKSRADYGAHSPFSLSICTKDNIFLAKLCVYFNSTPVLDQLLAMTFFVESGAEEQILETANLYGYDLPALKKHSVNSPALVAKVSLLESVAAAREKNGVGYVRQLIAKDPTIRAYDWWKEQYAPQTEQWCRAWIEDHARGVQACADVSAEARAAVEKLCSNGVGLSHIYAHASGELPSLFDIKRICSKQYGSGAAERVIMAIESQETQQLQNLRAQVNLPAVEPVQIGLLDVGACQLELVEEMLL